MYSPIVSIIIPSYNRAHIIGEMLNSLLAQTYFNWECIIVDDGSTDNTEEIVSGYIKKDSRIQFHYRPSLRLAGGNAARNYGFEMCKGEYVNFIDTDDILHPDFIKSKYNRILNSNCDVVISKTILTAMDIEHVIRYENRTILTPYLLDDFITLKISWYTFDPMWKKQFLVDKELFNENLLKGQDRDFHIRRLLEDPKIEILDEYLYYYRTNPISISTDISEKIALSMLKVGIERNKRLKVKKLSKETMFFLFKQMLKLYPYLYKSKAVYVLYISIFKLFFKFKRNYLLLSMRFFACVLSFNLIGKGGRLLK